MALKKCPLHTNIGLSVPWTGSSWMDTGLDEDAVAGRGQEERLGAVIGLFLIFLARSRALLDILAHRSTMQKSQRTGIPEWQRKEGRSKSHRDPTNTHQKNQISADGNRSLSVAWISFLWAALYLAFSTSLQMSLGDDKKLESTSLCSHNYRSQDHHDQIRTETCHWRTQGPRIVWAWAHLMLLNKTWNQRKHPAK